MKCSPWLHVNSNPEPEGPQRMSLEDSEASVGPHTSRGHDTYSLFLL